ncbi:3-phosphoshikimate 1-carboxyvinyltransferase [Bacillus canaveralius]|uniref:3-phosphoshikimate 1-carboxyvinyltransferase n=1 Tax=Bacillus canaveralius TaxID=1403243 RepID=A0A2N5GRU6_9BACI|nr:MULTISPECIES: 3-phosphoshikimate 1-carboxyvinyltransferase [Bacillus]PLR82782.1 3-phosphoshikimate 1-carboxyvinyltransferase [Bacillus sp. V33-4]PLR86167.1 3-phosphoshikimate 1-carboxyvinyltransferase [Bacillus canaveralius]PLS00287.1 3-phosphoshikimate 1-carboxyvinyltransferase [Bacillus canaveralius]RSK52087.1 3-phosphoshikimate 1-carboxyvinyltransferase [Bacillus canaveralius]
MHPKSKGLRGSIAVPGDKSISHRSVMFGAIAHGTTTVQHFLAGEDCLSTISCFRKLGVTIEQEGDRLQIIGKGIDGLREPSEVLDVGNSGTTIRLLLGILAGRPFHASLVGDSSIAKRPMTRVTRPLAAMGASIDGRNKGEFTPLSIRGGHLTGIEYKSPVASAQVKSSILFAGLQAEGETSVIEPSKTRDHTERMLQQFGGNVDIDGLSVKVTGGQQLKAVNIDVPGDVSSAAFFLVAAAITPNSELVLHNVGLNPTRTGILDVLEQMGADIKILPKKEDNAEPVGDIIIKTSALKGIEISGDLIPRLIDEIPVIALLATQANGTTVIKDAHELKVKETNRIDTVVNELTKLGAEIEATEDGMIIAGGSTLNGGHVDSHGDHRIGMMLAIASLICSGEVNLAESEAIAVSYPAFFEDLARVNVQ